MKSVSALAFVLCALASTLKAEKISSPDSPELLEHGRYLVYQVGLCIDCHSPRGKDGAYIPDLHLMGAPLPFVATVPMPWAPLAPKLAGLPAGYSREDMVRFLMTGQRPHKLPPPLPPMPEFRLNQSDAEAVTAYLASLKQDS